MLPLENLTHCHEKQGFKVDAFSDRRSAEDSFKNALPDLIILDIILGKEIGGGFEIAKYLLSFKTAIPVIFYAENIKSINLERKIEYSINLPENIMLNGDGFMLEQILDKLISNAKDFDDKTAPIKIIAN